MYHVELKPRAAKFISAQPAKIQRQLIRRIEALGENPRPQNAKILDSKRHVYRVRSGNYRIIYQIREHKLLVIVAKVGDRKEIYRRLDELLKTLDSPSR